MIRDQDQITDVFRFREYIFDTPERICVDMAMDALRMGAMVRNYTAAVALSRSAAGWEIVLRDEITGETGTATAKVLLNMTGAWIDQVNHLTGSRVPQKTFHTKGVNLAVRLPACAYGYGLSGLNREGEPIHIKPWKDFHYVGPTETIFEGDLDDVSPTEDEIEFLLSEINYLLPSVQLRRGDVLYAWAGVRPLTYDPAYPKGKRSRELHDFSEAGLPDYFAATAAPVMTHRTMGRELLEAIGKRVRPSGPPREPRYAGRKLFQPSDGHLGESGKAVIRACATEEQVVSLVDLMFARTGIGWNWDMGRNMVDKIAEAAAQVLGWGENEKNGQLQDYVAYIHRFHRAQQPVAAPSTAGDCRSPASPHGDL